MRQPWSTYLRKNIDSPWPISAIQGDHSWQHWSMSFHSTIYQAFSGISKANLAGNHLYLKTVNVLSVIQPINSRTDIQLPQFPSSETTVPQRPRCSSPQQAEIKPPKYFTTAKQADEAAQKAMHQRIHLLPNQGKLQATIGKCSDKRQEFENGLMNPSGPALDHPAAPLLSD